MAWLFINLADCGVLGAVAEPRGLRLAEVGNLRIKLPIMMYGVGREEK